MSDYQLIFLHTKISRIKTATHKHIKFRSLNHYLTDHFEETQTSINFSSYQDFSDAAEAMITSFRKLWLQLNIKHNSFELFDDEISEEAKDWDKFLKNLKNVDYIFMRNHIMWLDIRYKS